LTRFLDANGLAIPQMLAQSWFVIHIDDGLAMSTHDVRPRFHLGVAKGFSMT
jgi:hypothetical protein